MDPRPMGLGDVRDDSFENAGAPGQGGSSPGRIDPDGSQSNPSSTADTGSVPYSADSEEGTEAPTPSSGSEGTAIPMEPAAAKETDANAEIAVPPPNGEPSPSEETSPSAVEPATEVASDAEPVP